MTNADKFKSLFGIYATELWAMPEKNFLKWLNSEVSNCSEIPNNSDTISRQDAVKTMYDACEDIDDESLHIDVIVDALENLPSAESETHEERTETHACDLISRQDAIDALDKRFDSIPMEQTTEILLLRKDLRDLPSAEPEIIRCKNCKYWRQQTNYIGDSLSFGFCENDNMWGSLHGETCEVSHIDTDDDFYCGYAERRTE